MTLDRVTVDPNQMASAPCIRRLRIPAAKIVAIVADGMTTDEIVAVYPDLEREGVAQALRFAAEAVKERSLPLVA